MTASPHQNPRSRWPSSTNRSAGGGHARRSGLQRRRPQFSRSLVYSASWLEQGCHVSCAARRISECRALDSRAERKISEIPRKYHDLDPVVGGRELIPVSFRSPWDQDGLPQCRCRPLLPLMRMAVGRRKWNSQMCTTHACHVETPLVVPT